MTSGDGASGRFEPRRHGVAYALLAAWCAVVWFLSSRPDPEDTVGFRVPLPDYVLHGVEYAAGGLVAACAFSHLRRPLGGVCAFLFCVTYGVIDEWHQSFVPGRDADLGDAAADTVGAAIGVLAYGWIARRVRDRAP